MVVNNFLHNCQTNAGSFVICFTMQPLKQIENDFTVLLFKANTIIRECEVTIADS